MWLVPLSRPSGISEGCLVADALDALGALASLAARLGARLAVALGGLATLIVCCFVLFGFLSLHLG